MMEGASRAGRYLVAALCCLYVAVVIVVIWGWPW